MKIVKTIALGLLGALLAQQIYAHALTAIYGERCSLPDKHWWGEFYLCRPDRP